MAGKVAAIVRAPEPKDVKELRAFLKRLGELLWEVHTKLVNRGPAPQSVAL